MTAETTIYAALKNDAAVSAIVGVGDAARVYPDIAPLTVELPAIGYQRLETQPITTIHASGPLASIVRLEVACMSRSRLEADSLSVAATAALAAQKFIFRDRRAELVGGESNERGVWATVLTVDFLEQ